MGVLYISSTSRLPMSQRKFPWNELWGYFVYEMQLKDIAGGFQLSFETKEFISIKINDRSTVAFKHKRHVLSFSGVLWKFPVETHQVSGPSLGLLLFYIIEESSEASSFGHRLLDSYQHFLKHYSRYLIWNWPYLGSETTKYCFWTCFPNKCTWEMCCSLNCPAG